MEMYTGKNSEYFQKNPTWDVADSPWKAEKAFELIRKHGLHPKTVAEIGCGAGEILNQLRSMLPDDVVFSGFDISEDAIVLAKSREKERLTFYNDDLLIRDEHYDLLIMMDVFEHVEDYLGFLRKCRRKADWTVFNIPLDLSVQGMIRNSFYSNRENVGHLHYFTKDTALATLKDAGYEIVEWKYASMQIDQKMWNPIALTRKIMVSISPDFMVRLLGGFTLSVIAR